MQYFSRDSNLIDRSGMTQDDVESCFRVLEGMRRWQAAARALSEASRRYMKLNDSDMRAIRMMIRSQEQGLLVTPKDIAREVGISSASTTKLIDRLVDGGHVTRVPHPSDRRTMCLRVTESTRRSAHDTIGRQHARRFSAVASLDAHERETVIRFLTAMIEADAPQGELAAP